jgi:hypothetical protein
LRSVRMRVNDQLLAKCKWPLRPPVCFGME